jgi:hypothetical protein
MRIVRTLVLAIICSIIPLPGIFPEKAAGVAARCPGPASPSQNLAPRSLYHVPGDQKTLIDELKKSVVRYSETIARKNGNGRNGTSRGFKEAQTLHLMLVGGKTAMNWYGRAQNIRKYAKLVKNIKKINPTEIIITEGLKLLGVKIDPWDLLIDSAVDLLIEASRRSLREKQETSSKKNAVEIAPELLGILHCLDRIAYGGNGNGSNGNKNGGASKQNGNGKAKGRKTARSGIPANVPGGEHPIDGNGYRLRFIEAEHRKWKRAIRQIDEKLQQANKWGARIDLKAKRLPLLRQQVFWEILLHDYQKVDFHSLLRNKQGLMNFIFHKISSSDSAKSLDLWVHVLVDIASRGKFIDKSAYMIEETRFLNSLQGAALSHFA